MYWILTSMYGPIDLQFMQLFEFGFRVPYYVMDSITKDGFTTSIISKANQHQR
jgi:hypothetical protein